MNGFFYFLGTILLAASSLYTKGRKRQRFLFLGVAFIVLGIILMPDFIPDFIEGFKNGIGYWTE